MDKIQEIKEKTKDADEFYLENGVGMTKDELNWLIEQASQLSILSKEVSRLKNIISQCRCEDCGNELGDTEDFSYGILCKDCLPKD